MEHIQQYLPILIFAAIACGIAIVLVLIPFFTGPIKWNREKLSQYECGFESFDKKTFRFDIRFYLVAILFIIFDLEIAFLFPWSIVIHSIGLLGFWSMMVFLMILTVGFIYEWKKGALDWE